MFGSGGYWQGKAGVADIGSPHSSGPACVKIIQGRKTRRSFRPCNIIYQRKFAPPCWAWPWAMPSACRSSFSPAPPAAADPVTGMRAFGTHHQPAGTWSDDASLTFCLAETLALPGGLTGPPRPG